MKRFLIILALLIPPEAYAAPATKIAWEPVPGAWGYFLEIKNSSGSVIVSREIRESYYSVAGFEPGEYSFRIATLNMMKQRGESSGWSEFTVEKLYVPKLKSVSKKQFISSYTNRKITLSGNNFRPDTRIVLRGNGKEIELDDIDVISDKEVQVDFKPSVSMKGSYDLVVINRGDAESVLKKAVEIVEPAEAERFYYITAGYMTSTPSGVWADYLAPSYTGAMLALQFSLKNPLFENILLEAETCAAQFDNLDEGKKSSLRYASFGLGAGYYYPVYSLNIELFMKFNTGPMYSVLLLDENLKDSEISSYDWFVKAGVGLRIFFGDSFYIEPSAGWKTSFYTGEYIHLMEANISAGVKI